MKDPPPGTVAAVYVPVLLSIAKVAGVLGCSPRTVRRRIAEGLLPAVIENERTMVRGDELINYIERLERVGNAVADARRPRGPGRNYTFLRE